MKYCIFTTLIILLAANIGNAQCDDYYIFKDKKHFTTKALEPDVYAEDGQTRIVLDISFTIQSDWYIHSNEEVNAMVYADFMTGPETGNQQVLIAIPKDLLVCLDKLSDTDRATFYIGSLHKMYDLLSQQTSIIDELEEQPIRDKETLDFFYNNYTYTAKRLIENGNTTLQLSDIKKYITIALSPLYYDSDDGIAAIARLFAIQPNLFSKSYKTLTEMQQEQVAEALKDDFPTIIKDGANGTSIIDLMKNELSDLDKSQQLNTIMNFYQPFLDRMHIRINPSSAAKSYLKVGD